MRKALFGNLITTALLKLRELTIKKKQNKTNRMVKNNACVHSLLDSGRCVWNGKKVKVGFFKGNCDCELLQTVFVFVENGLLQFALFFYLSIRKLVFCFYISFCTKEVFMQFTEDIFLVESCSRLTFLVFLPLHKFFFCSNQLL